MRWKGEIFKCWTVARAAPRPGVRRGRARAAADPHLGRRTAGFHRRDFGAANMKPILLIDSGNTRLKLGVIGDVDAETRVSSAGAGRGHWNGDIPTHALDNDDDIQSLKEWLSARRDTPVAALGTNVAGEARAAIIEATLTQIGCPLRWIVPQAEAYGLTSRYTRPEQLGADRWVSMLGVLASRDASMRASSVAYRCASSAPAATAGVAGAGRYHRPLEAQPLLPKAHPPFLLASFGTATTLDTVSGDNVFEGGLILPGPALMRQSSRREPPTYPWSTAMRRPIPQTPSTRFLRRRSRAGGCGAPAVAHGPAALWRRPGCLCRWRRLERGRSGSPPFAGRTRPPPWTACRQPSP